MAHSQFGRQAGLTDEDIKELLELDPADFDPKEYAALAWVRDYALFEGAFPDAAVAAAFELSYTEQERRDILAVITVMGFANRWNNTFTGQVLDEGDIGK